MSQSPALAGTNLAALLAQYAPNFTAPQLVTDLTTFITAWQPTPAVLANILTFQEAQIAQFVADASVLSPIKGAVPNVQSLPAAATAAPGDSYLVQSTGHGYGLIAGAWVDLGQFQGPPGSTVVSMAFAVSGPNAGNELFPPYTADGAILLSQANSIGSADAPATADAVYTLLRNGASFGTATYKAGTAFPVFAFSGTVQLSRADRVRPRAPATPDATLVGASITISGNRTQ